jgi:hypothetical protein
MATATSGSAQPDHEPRAKNVKDYANSWRQNSPANTRRIGSKPTVNGYGGHHPEQTGTPTLIRTADVYRFQSWPNQLLLIPERGTFILHAVHSISSTGVISQLDDRKAIEGWETHADD